MSNSYVHKRRSVNKFITRSLVCESISKPARRALLLPSSECEDVVALLESGKADLETKFDLIERDPQVAEEIEKVMIELGFTKNHFRVHNCEVTNFPFSDTHDQTPFDLVYLDLCGQLTLEVFNWLCEHNLALRSVRSFSATFNIEHWSNLFFRDNYSEHPKWQRAPRFSQLGSGFLGNKADKLNSVALWVMGQTASALDYWRGDGSGDHVRNDNSALCRSRYPVKFFHAYKEAGKSACMVFFTLPPFSLDKRLRERDNAENNLAMSTGGTKNIMSKKNPVMVLAGKKAARTRKLNRLQREYDSANSPGVKSAIRRRMNQIESEPID